jgi:hypothetical protein
MVVVLLLSQVAYEIDYRKTHTVEPKAQERMAADVYDNIPRETYHHQQQPSHQQYGQYGPPGKQHPNEPKNAY